VPSPEAVIAFRKIYAEKFNVELSDEEAMSIATRTLQLVYILEAFHKGDHPFQPTEAVNPGATKGVGLKSKNRLRGAMLHVPRYAKAGGIQHLAEDTGISASSISRILSGKMQPSFRTVTRLTKVFEQTLNRSIDPGDLVTEQSLPYPTTSLCTVLGCAGCMPTWYLDELSLR